MHHVGTVAHGTASAHVRKLCVDAITRLPIELRPVGRIVQREDGLATELGSRHRRGTIYNESRRWGHEIGFGDQREIPPINASRDNVGRASLEAAVVWIGKLSALNRRSGSVKGEDKYAAVIESEQGAHATMGEAGTVSGAERTAPIVREDRSPRGRKPTNLHWVPRVGDVDDAQVTRGVFARRGARLQRERQDASVGALHERHRVLR